MDRNALTATAVTHAWRSDAEPVLREVSLALRPGELLGVVGPNGAGKSTLVKVLGGILQPRSGYVTIDGDDLSALPARERARRVAYVPQREVVPSEITVRDYVSLGRSPWASWTGRMSPTDLTAIDAALEACALHALAARPYAALSGGEQRRCATARALAQGARFLLLDEPLASLDTHHQVALCELLRDRADVGRAVLAVFHEINLAAQVCDRVLLLDDGRVLADLPPAEALSPSRLQQVFPCAFLTGHTDHGAPYAVPLTARSASRDARTPR